MIKGFPIGIAVENLRMQGILQRRSFPKRAQEPEWSWKRSTSLSSPLGHHIGIAESTTPDG